MIRRAYSGVWAVGLRVLLLLPPLPPRAYAPPPDPPPAPLPVPGPGNTPSPGLMPVGPLPEDLAPPTAGDAPAHRRRDLRDGERPSPRPRPRHRVDPRRSGGIDRLLAPPPVPLARLVGRLLARDLEEALEGRRAPRHALRGDAGRALALRL